MSDDKKLAIPETNVDLSEISNMLPSATPVDVAKELGSTTGFLPYLVIVQGQSNLAAPPYSINQGHFALRRRKNDIEDMGAELDVYILDWRPKAMFSDRENNTIENQHDHENERFKEIQEAANVKVDGYFWGYEFLLLDCDSGEFMTLFCNNPTLRRASQEVLLPMIRNTVTIKAEPLDDGKYKWWGISCKESSAALKNELGQEELLEVVKNFKNPPQTVINDDTISVETETEEEDRPR